MCLAEADARVNVEGIEHHRIAALGAGYLFGRRVSERIGAADDKSVEGQAGVERRAAERLMHAWVTDRKDAAIAVAIREAAAVLARRKVGFWLWQHSRFQDGRSHDQLDACHFAFLGLPAGQNAFGIMRLDPAFQEAGRYR